MTEVALSPRLEPLKMGVFGAKLALERQDSGVRHSTQTMEQYVRSKGGKRAITKILIANNGIAAVKAIRSIRKWAYETFGNDRIIEFVAMATPEDLKANAAYIHLADEFVNVPGGTNNNNYANVMLIADIAERCGAHAVWAGWGHASENPKLPEALAKTKNKCVWMGPPPSAMRALGDKIGSTLIAQSAGVPCMAWSGDGLTVNYAESGIPDDIYQQSCVTSAIQAEQAAQRIGYPIMIKASEGGGGKGIRKVEKQEDVKLAFAQVQGEVPGSPIFLMKLAPVCRHLEVQLLADEDGEAIAVHGRDCSIQRRHQKIIEEGPVVAAPPEIWRRMEQSAVRLAKEVGYVGAGTVEYLYMDTGDYCFLELNPRLQVEHPVTELISGVNLPAAQLQIAMGIPLRNIRGVRRMYGEDPDGSSFIDFEKRHGQTLPGHVIACRVTAENPDEKFQPTSGVIVELNFRSTPNVWGYFSVAARGGVHEFSDSQFGHMFALGETREIARTNMVLALKELSIRGDIRTTVEYLSRILETEDFICNRITTTWLEKVMAERTIEAEKPKTHLAVIMGALFRAFKSSTARLKEYMGLIERGQLPSSSLHAQLIESDVELIYEKIKYKFKVTKSGPNRFDLSINDWMVSADCLALSDDGILVLVDGKKHVVYGQEFPVGLRLIVDGKTCLFHEEYDPTQLRSSMQGKLVRYLIPDGAHILKEKPYAEIEVMKMYITLMAPESGILKALKPEGSIIEAGDLLATLTLDEPDKIQRAELFLGTLPRMREPHHIGDKSSAILADALKRLHMLLSGYQLGPGVIKRTVDELLSCLRDPSLPLSQFKEILSTLSGRIPIPLFDAFQEIATDYAKAIVTPKFYWESGESFPVSMIQDAITSCQQSLSDTEKSILTTSLTTSGVFRLIEQYRDGNETYVVQVLTQLFEEYFEVENYFHGEKRPEMVIKELRKSFHNDLDMVARIARAHHQIGKRNELILMLLHVIEQQLAPLLVEFMPLLKKLTALVGKEYASIVVKARQLIMKQELPSSSQRRIAIQTILNGAAGLSIEQRSERLSPLIDQSQPIEDLIFDFFEHKRPAVQLVAMEVYIRRVYQVYHLSNIQVDIVKDHGGYLRGYWSFYLETERGRCDSDMDQRTIASHMSKLSEREVQQKINMLKSESVKDIEKLRSPIASTSALSKMVDESEEDIFDTHGTQTPPVGRVLPKRMKSNVAKHKAARCGVMAFFKDIECAKRGFLDVLTIFDSSIQFMEPVHVLYIGVKWSTKLPSDESLSQQLKGLVKSHQPQLQEKGVRRVTFIVTHGKEEYPAYFTFRHNLDSEDTIIRHIEPSYALHMQLQRLSNFEIRLMSTTNRLVHLFAAIPQGIKADANTIPEVYDGRRFFVRSLVRKLDSHSLYPSSSSDDDLDAYPETEFAFVEALNALEMAIAGEFRGWRENSIFLNVLVEAVVELDYIEAVIRLLARRYSDKIRRLNIAMVELCISLKPHADSLLSIPYRFVCTNPTGYVLNITIYEEKRDPTSNKIIFHTQGPKKGIWDGQEIYTPYPISLPLMKQRSTAWAAETLYVYDYITLFEHALARAWQRHNNKKNGYAKDTVSVKESLEIKQNDGTPSIYITSVELILDPTHTSLIESTRVPGINDVGMIAWKWMIYTPEYPKGRSLIVIANDITYQAGTFGTTEDLVFDLASKYARKHGLPRIYIAANSGARIGLAEELRHKFRIAWNQGDVSKGMSYIYLTPEDYQQYKDCVIAHEMTVPEGDVDAGQIRYAIHDIIGRKHGLGVENLRGSGTIAGETSCAYEEIFTLTYVAGRSVGIGAYLARLGQRVIQKEPQPIILTGYNALNKLLGKTVYTSNVQLGGPDIMYTNGVSHQTVDNDMHGVQAILSWLSYVPAVRHQSFVATATKTCDDPIERRIAFRPGKNPYDPRHLCAGMIDPTTQTWISGFFDQHSFIEILGGWARSVVVGRARLGGIPMGVIVVETRTIEQIRPADPANPESKEQTLQRAGQVWYPDSAFKTAQGIRDMITEDIPLMIFANWRGFSGGMQDMFDEILKFGSYIVDALRAYRHPVFVYIPPYGTLRGGAWVVVDSTINEQYMEMYADESGRGGVLETEGTLDVKFRKKDILVLCHRLDPVLMKLDQELNALSNESKSNTTPATTPSTTSSTAPSSSQCSATQIRADIAARERIIFPLYHQTAAAFADLHDTPGRMQAKGCIHGMVRWEEARTFFYHRLQRRNAELNVISRIQQADPSYKVENGWKRALSLLHEWVVRDVSSTYSTGILSNDQLFAGWLDSHQTLIDQSIQQLHIAYQQQQLSQIIQTIPNKELVNGLAGIITGLTDAQKQQLKKALQLS